MIRHFCPTENKNTKIILLDKNSSSNNSYNISHLSNNLITENPTFLSDADVFKIQFLPIVFDGKKGTRHGNPTQNNRANNSHKISYLSNNLISDNSDKFIKITKK